MTPINKQEFNETLKETLKEKVFPIGYEINEKKIEAYSCLLISDEIDLCIYRERYFSPLEIILHLKKLNLKYEIFSLVEALLNRKSIIYNHLHTEGLFFLQNSNFKTRFWMNKTVKSNADLRAIFDLIFDWYIEEVIPLLKENDVDIEENRRQYFRHKTDGSKEQRNDPKYLAELEIIWKKRNPPLIELIHREIIGNTNSKSEKLNQTDEEYLNSFENTFKVKLPTEYKELIKAKEGFSYLLDLPETIIEIPNFNNFTYFIDLEGEFDELNPCPKNVKGVLRIADFGCGVSHLLILNGKEKGNIWIDDRANADKIFPYLDLNKNKVNFEMWKVDNGMQKMYAN
jgi:hypothetical protein